MSELEARFDPPAGLEAPTAARAAVRSMLIGWGFHDKGWVDHAVIVVSELVTNAVLHGGGCLSLELHAHDNLVTIAAADGSSVVPQVRDADVDGGRGLRLIEEFSTGWGVHDHEGGKRVWVQLRPHPTPPRLSAPPHTDN